jgi:tRNA dimethylallyltransferase
LSIASNKVLILFGPTAVGKTATIDRLHNDDRLREKPVVIVSADSVQIYRGLDIGSAKPDAAALSRMKHELIDILDPSQGFSVGEFVRLADEACTRALESGALPVLSGGTAYYIKAFMFGPPPAPPSDPLVRAAIQQELATRGPEALRQELAAVDPESAARLAPADLYRITRALEVYRCCGKPLSTFKPDMKMRPRWDTLVLGLDRLRPELYARIEARVDAMVAAGLPAEVEALIASGYGADAPGMKAIGYAEFLQAGSNPSATRLPEIVDEIKLHTKHYAKRQLTFMRSLPGVRWFDADDYDGVVSTVARWL